MSYEYLEHHGILGQKWGIRRYQNKDGSYTVEGRDRHADAEDNKTNTERGKEAQTKYKTAKRNLKNARKTKDPDKIKRAKAKYKDVKKATKKDLKYRYNSDDKLKDRARYGIGADKSIKRIEKRINEKGKTRNQARRIENGRQLVNGVLFSAGILALSNPKAAASIAKGSAVTMKLLAAKGGEKLAKNVVAKRAAKAAINAIPKIAQNSKFDPIDTTMRILR